MSEIHVLVVDDEPDIRQLVQDILEDEGYRVTTADSASAARRLLAATRPDLMLLDIWMPEEDGITLLTELTRGGHGTAFPVVMMSGHGTVETAVEATRLGAVDFVEKPLSMGRLLATVESALRAGSQAVEAATAGPEMIEPIGHGQRMQALREQARRIASSPSWVLVTGEPGAGKKLFARYLHALGGSGGPLIEIAGGVLTGEGAARELFGDEQQGRRQVGRLEAAIGGTLILDEVADLDAGAQTRLAAAIEAGSFQRVGGTERIPLDLRLIAVTGHDLAAEAKAGRFREDLLLRLEGMPLRVPPLREHSEDVPELLSFYVDYFVDRERLPYRRFTVAAQNRLRNHGWPGNVRELRNLVQRLLVLGEGVDIRPEEVEQALSGPDAAPGAAPTESLASISLDQPLREAREAFERVYLLHQLRRAEGSVARLARLTGMERTHLYRKLRALGIDPKETG